MHRALLIWHFVYMGVHLEIESLRLDLKPKIFLKKTLSRYADQIRSEGEKEKHTATQIRSEGEKQRTSPLNLTSAAWGSHRPASRATQASREPQAARERAPGRREPLAALVRFGSEVLCFSPSDLI